MAESIVTDWIGDFNSLEPQQLKTFAALHAENHELSTAIHTIFNDKSKHQEYLHPICNQLYNFYRSNETELKCFTLQFIPNLIYLYLNAVSCGEKHNYRCVETLLVCAYNMEVCNENGLLKSVSFRMPVLAQASIYHEEKNLHASDLKRWEDHSNKEISWRSLQQIYKVTAHNRMTMMSALMFIFNQQLSLIQKSALYHLCKSSSKLATQGYTKFGHSYRSSYGNDPVNTSTSLNSSSTGAPTSNINKIAPRIQLSQQLLLEILNAIYFAMFNEFASAAIQAVEDIHNRACYELYTDVILVTNAIKNSLQANPSGQPSDGPMGISVALTPSTTVVTVSKSMITNASFRTKKLPDDLEFVDLKHLQVTQDEMMKRLALLDDHENICGEQQSKLQKKTEGVTKRFGLKGWSWKQSPAKSTSIEEEQQQQLSYSLQDYSPKKSLSSKSSTPNQSPKHRISSSETIRNCLSDEITSFRRKKHQKQQIQQNSDFNRNELRASASARLIQLYDSKDEIDKFDPEYEFRSLLPANGRPASIHVIQQTVRSDDF
ncbi:hypothetical protein PVAND_008222 [Polypedilum vanderplanki]|uniref:Hyccin n=1 Tax=Polypedilum vanderplanki TaxID=319348 RepID=A0A9J6C9G2_POLVA|nr:hypothetical protein PVAND_008222 [Polypedilum vanderplanki]